MEEIVKAMQDLRDAISAAQVALVEIEEGRFHFAAHRLEEVERMVRWARGNVEYARDMEQGAAV